jgi:AcrR family transcriptional regulator
MTRTYTAPIRSAQAAASRRLILDAALRLFSRDGYAATTLTAVAEEAGLAAETIYKHFQNKPNVLQQLLAREITGSDSGDKDEGLSHGQVLELTAEPDPAERLRAFCGLARRVYEDTAMLQRVFVEAAGTSPELRERWRANRARRVQDTRAVLSSFAEEGSLTISLDVGADITWTLASPEVFTMLVQERGWDTQRYERWLYDILHAELLASPPQADEHHGPQAKDRDARTTE